MEPEQSKVHKDKQDNQEAGPDYPDKEDSFSSSLTPLENKTIINFIDNFSSHFGDQLSEIMGKKIDVEFSSLESINTKEKINQENDFIISTFSITNHTNLGLILLDKYFLDSFINYLFGYAHIDEKKTEVSFGKCSLNIAKEICSRGLVTLKQTLSQFIEFNATLLRTSNFFKDIVYQNSGEKSYEFSFKVNDKNSSHSFIVILPEKIVEEIIFDNQSKQLDSEHPITQGKSEQLKNNVIDTTLDLIAVFSDIRLTFNDVLNLKSGDLIPISDPTKVDLRVGNKKLFSALVGQANSYRVVKTIDSYNK